MDFAHPHPNPLPLAGEGAAAVPPLPLAGEGRGEGMVPTQLIAHEARLLDEKRYDDWLALFADDGRYWVPLQGALQDEGAAHNPPPDQDPLLLKVGLSVSLSGPNSSLGVPYAKGMQAAVAYKPEINGRKVQLIVLDDGSDPTNAGRNARKLVEEEKVDILMGSSGVPATIAISQVGRESKTPMIGLSPISLAPAESDWTVTVAQPPQLMIDAVVQRMKRDGVKTVGYIGFTDAWGDLVYSSLTKAAEPAGIKVVTNERYARSDQSVTGQVLKIVAARPDAVMMGGSGTPGALPHIALADRGYRGPEYSTHAIINKEFVRVGGAAVDGVIAPTGPVVVAEQLPESNPIR